MTKRRSGEHNYLLAAVIIKAMYRQPDDNKCTKSVLRLIKIKLNVFHRIFKATTPCYQEKTSCRDQTLGMVLLSMP